MIFGSLIAAAMLQARPPSATMYYVEALRATRAAQQPASLRFEERLGSQGMKFETRCRQRRRELCDRLRQGNAQRA